MTDATVRIADLVGVAEIAERVHLSKQAVSGWYRNGLSHMPEPTLVLKMGALWEWPTIVRWLNETGRDHYLTFEGERITAEERISNWSLRPTE